MLRFVQAASSADTNHTTDAGVERECATCIHRWVREAGEDVGIASKPTSRGVWVLSRLLVVPMPITRQMRVYSANVPPAFSETSRPVGLQHSVFICMKHNQHVFEPALHHITSSQHHPHHPLLTLSVVICMKHNEHVLTPPQHHLHPYPQHGYSPSPWSFACSTMSTYFTSTISVCAQKMREMPPSTSFSVGSGMGEKTAVRAYMGEVPMSPCVLAVAEEVWRAGG